ncbi:MAG: NUDIX domain-containing protein [Clostridia bacterium]|nr:NUDIX domain-containing protein [Clostridia bacterium]
MVERGEAHEKGIRHRTAHLWLLRRKNGATEILLQKRALIKSSFPGCYDVSSAGHIPAGGDYAQSAVRELKEELGLDAKEDELIPCGDRTIIWDDVFFGKEYHDRQYTRVFALWRDPKESDYRFQAEEVASVLWMSLDECIEGVKRGDFENCIEIEELMMVKNAAVRD